MRIFYYFFYCNTIRYLQPHYRLSTDSLQPTTGSLQTLYSLLQTLYKLSTAYYRLSTDSLQPTMDSLQTLYSLLWTLYSSTMALYSLSTASTDSLQPHCRSAAALPQQCCAEHRGHYRHYSTTALCSTAAVPLQHCAANQSLLMGVYSC